MARTTSTLGRCKDTIHRVRADQLSHVLARRPSHGKNRSFASAQDDSLERAAVGGLPHSEVRQGIVASSTSGSMGVVAFWSRQITNAS
jgi:hypothetical protein